MCVCVCLVTNPLAVQVIISGDSLVAERPLALLKADPHSRVAVSAANTNTNKNIDVTTVIIEAGVAPISKRISALTARSSRWLADV